MFEALIADLRGSFVAVPPEVAGARLLAALLLGGAIGWERERRVKPAGLRTHMLISMAAALFILISQELVTMDFGGKGQMRPDPLRLIEAVTAGVAFLAAGAIFTAGGKVRNLTTGAGMWMAGAIGVACGAGRLPLALMATVIVVTVMIVIGWAERRWGSKGPSEDEYEHEEDARKRLPSGGRGASRDPGKSPPR